MRRGKISSSVREAFTLMELMLVMAILVIMAGMVAVAYQNIAGGAEFDLCNTEIQTCLLYTSPSPRDQRGSRMPSSA